MRCSELLGRDVSADFEILGVCDDTRALPTEARGWVFVFDQRILPGRAQALCQQALAAGAVVVANVKMERVTFHELPGVVLARWAKAKFPMQPRYVTAVTGTNGKTSVAWFYMQLMQALGQKGKIRAASVGTLGVFVNGKKVRETGYTSPTALVVHEILHELANDGVTHVCVEASSHALALGRLDGVDFTAAAFTNLSQDHLDFHGDMATYHAAKGRLFAELLPERGTAVLPMQRAEAWPIAAACKQREVRVLSYGSGQAELCVRVEQATAAGLALRIKYNEWDETVQVGLVGAFQAENVAAAVGLCVGSGGELVEILPQLANLQPVPGRMELLEKKAHQPTVVVDYAHTPDALERALESLRPLVPAGGKLYCVFGAGGDRDNQKRPLMGAVAAKLADVSVVTDDNPRTEDAGKIRQQILQGTENEREIGDRVAAIKWAIGAAGENDIVLLAGKGHEVGQIVGKEVLPHDDKKVALDILESL